MRVSIANSNSQGWKLSQPLGSKNLSHSFTTATFVITLLKLFNNYPTKLETVNSNDNVVQHIVIVDIANFGSQ